MHIRLTKPADIPVLAELLTTVWQASYQAIFPASVLSAIESSKWQLGLEKSLHDPCIQFYVAEEGKQLIGMLAFGHAREPQFGESEIYVVNVLPDFQRHGVGKALMNVAFAALSGKTIYLHVATLNQQARAFYAQLGFVESPHHTEREMWGVRFSQTVYQKKEGELSAAGHR